jgi:hypothetical protein
MSVATISCPALDTITAAFTVRQVCAKLLYTEYQEGIFRNTRHLGRSALNAQTAFTWTPRKRLPSRRSIPQLYALPAHVLAVPCTTGTRRGP